MNKWKIPDGRFIFLITPEQLSSLKDGTKLINIFGQTFTVGIDNIDDDTRGGYCAFGLLEEMI